MFFTPLVLAALIVSVRSLPNHNALRAPKQVRQISNYTGAVAANDTAPFANVTVADISASNSSALTGTNGTALAANATGLVDSENASNGTIASDEIANNGTANGMRGGKGRGKGRGKGKGKGRGRGKGNGGGRGDEKKADEKKGGRKINHEPGRGKQGTDANGQNAGDANKNTSTDLQAAGDGVAAVAARAVTGGLSTLASRAKMKAARGAQSI